jgi:glycosyltransferase involved in cell wall biosynthesis
MKGKGYEELIDALAILSSKGKSIRLVIYFGEGCHGLDQARELAAARGVAHMIEWREFLAPEELSAMYQSSKACIVPYTGGSARHPLSCALANATPVIATRTVDIQEYLGDLGLYVEGTGASIAQAISQVEEQLSDFRSLGTKMRERAIAELNIEKIARDMRCFYSRFTERN